MLTNFEASVILAAPRAVLSSIEPNQIKSCPNLWNSLYQNGQHCMNTLPLIWLELVYLWKQLTLPLVKEVSKIPAISKICLLFLQEWVLPHFSSTETTKKWKSKGASRVSNSDWDMTHIGFFKRNLTNRIENIWRDWYTLH